MKLLACWPIPEVFTCLILAVVAGAIIQDRPTSIVAAVIIGLTVAAIGGYLRQRHDPAVRKYLRDQPHNPQDGQP